MPVTEKDLTGQDSVPNISKEEQPIATGSEAENITGSLGKNPDVGQVSGSDVRSQIEYIERGHEAGLINDTTHSSIVIRHNGQINLSASHYSQYKLNPSGKIVEQSMESVSMTNRRKIATNDLLMNEHKVNPYLYELADMRKMVLTQNDNVLGGNFCVLGSVLVKAWDKNLKRYMMIRRPARVPLFSTILNIPEINQGLGITDPLKIDEDILAKTDKGFQVNKVISDSKTLVGKLVGEDRAGGTDRGKIIEFNEGSGGSGSTASTTNTSTNTNNTTTPSGPIDPKTAIKGKAEVTQEQMVKYIKSRNPNPSITCSVEDLVKFYYEEAEAEGIRPDVLICQAIKETGTWSFGGDAKPEQNNYAGIGTTGGGVPGHSFKNAQEGARAHVQHMVAYLGGTPTKEIVDPRFQVAKEAHGGKGITAWPDLNGKWAVPGNNYGQEILQLWEAAKAM